MANNIEWQKYQSIPFETIVASIQNPMILQTGSILPDYDIEIETNETFAVYFPDGSMNTTTGRQSNIGELQDLTQEASVNQHDIAYCCNLLKEAVPDYKDNNFVNTCLLQFPYGRGGMHEERLHEQGKTITTLDIEEYAKHLSMISQKHFHCELFTLIVFNLMMKQRMLKTAVFKVKDEVSSRMLAIDLQYSDIEKAIDATKYARGFTTVETQRGRQYIQSVDAMCAALPHTNNAAKCEKHNSQAIHHRYGFPTFFLTVTPDDDNHYTIQVLSQQFIDVNYQINNMSNEALFEKSKLRTKLRLKYPGLCV
jgi:hypothetical protein